MRRIEASLWPRAIRLFAEQLFPLTFKENSTISNPTETVGCVLSSFEYHDNERNQ